jgi:hypothetical protein
MALPLLVPLAISGGIAAAQAIGKNMPTAADKRNKQKLNELLELEKKRELGLTGQEMKVAEARTEMPMAQQLSAQMAAQNRALAAGGAGVGASLAAGQQMADTGALARQQAISDIEALDLQKKQAQLQEIEDRTAAKAQRDMEKREAVLDAVGDVAQTGLGLYSQGITTQGPSFSKTKQESLSPQLQKIIQALEANPELIELIMRQGE